MYVFGNAATCSSGTDGSTRTANRAGTDEQLGVRAVVDAEPGAVLEPAAPAKRAAPALHVRVRGDAVPGSEALDVVAGVDDVAADVDAEDRLEGRRGRRDASARGASRCRDG